MQYKGFKQMKRVAAVILSAAIVLADVPGVSAAEYSQVPETEAVGETAQDAGAEEPAAEEAVAEDAGAESAALPDGADTDGQEAQQQTQQTQSSTENGAEAEQTAAAAETETAEAVETEVKPPETETEASETEAKPSETETAGDAETQQASSETEMTGTEVTETEETETEETETEETETEITQEQESVPVPDVDDSVYAFEHAEDLFMNNAAPLVSYNAGGTLEKNEQGEYVIDNKDQFVLFLASAADYSDSTVRLNCDVDMKGETAQFAKSFQGTFIGNGHSIYNYQAEGGLFREIGTNGEVRGLHLSGVAFSTETASAALAAANSGTITNVTVNADFRVTKDMTAAAGIVLQNDGTISNCVFAGTITADAETDNAGKMIGGIVSSNKGTVDNCHTLGSITTNAAQIGGIAAQNYKTVRNCSNHMTVTGAYAVGGIAAENTRTISNCVNYGDVTQTRSSEEGLAGGIAAKNTDTISDCENYAKVLGEHKDIGGIAGSSSGTVTRCGNYGTVSGAENTGGIVGIFEGTGDDESNLIKNSFNKGTIDAKSNSNSNNQGIGGILGAASKNAVLTIENCYNTAGVNGASETKYLGGIAGVLYKGAVKNTYNAGSVSAAAMTDEFNPYAAVIAGFMGPEADAVCTGCLFLEGSRDILYYRESGAVKAESEKKTAAELMGADALLVLGDGFAADSDGSVNEGYPVIRGQHAQAFQYIIMYEPHGGCMDSYFEAVAKGSPASNPGSPAKKSASFLGWFADKENTAPYRFSESVTKSAVVYAGWENGKLVEDFTLAQTEVTLVVGETFSLRNLVKFTPESAENTALEFKSGNPDVAAVDDAGIITAVSGGTADITVRLADKSLDKELVFKVTVSDKENIVRFKLYDDKNTAEFTSLSVSVNDPVTVQAVFGADAPMNATVQWTTSRPDYVKVTKRADLVGVNTAILEGLKPTTTLDENGVDIMCTLIYPNEKTFTGILRVTVKPLAESISLQAGKEDVTGKTLIYDIGTKKFIAVEDTVLSNPTDTLSATILPKAANQKVNWSSSNSYVIKFDDEESGKAVSSAIGEATITATAADGSKDKDGKPVIGKATVKTRRIIQAISFTPKPVDGNGSISVDKDGRIEIAEGASVRLVPTYTPADATVQKLKWTNGNKNALDLTKVEEGTNALTVTAKKVAQNTIVKLRADATDMGGAYSEIEFIIKPKVEKIKIFRTDDTKQERNLSGNSIGIDPEKDSMTFGLVAVNEPDNASQMVTWKINNTKVADFTDNGDGTCTVKVKGVGSAVITATATDGSKTTATTMLNVNTLASNVEIEGSNMVMKGKTIKLKATVYPKTAKNKNVKWISLAPDYASVNESTGEVRGIQAGYALISATANDGSGASGTHVIWVKDPVENFDIMEPDGDDNLKNDVLVTGKTIGIDPDNGTGEYKVAARILPDTAGQDVEWKSSNEKIATVEPGSGKEATITAKALGKATITASAVDGSGRKASVTVNIGTLVKSIKITGGHYLGAEKELQLKAEVGDKDATNKTVVWKSDNPRVATVKDGLVKAEGKDGDAIITAEAADGSGVKAEHRIYVVNKKNNVSVSSVDDNAYRIWTDTSGGTKKKFINDIDLSDKETIVLRLRAELSDGSAVRDGVPMDIKWSASNSGVATVEAEEGNSSIGVVTVRKAGTVRIIATSAEGYESTDYVTLSIKNTNPFVRIQGTGHRLAFGKRMKLSTGSVAVDWYSNNEQVAKVNSKGQVTAGKDVSGTAIITASALDGNHFDTYTIQVGEAVQTVGIQMNGNQDVTGQKIGLDLMKGYKGNPIQLRALLNGVVSSDVTWKTSNKNIAEMDEDGYLDIKKNGNVTFTATASDGSNKKAKVTFVITKQITGMSPAGNIKDIEVGLKKSVQLNVDYKPLAGTMKKAVWVSDNPSVVTVSKNGGKITGKAEGTAKITATAADNSDVSCEFHITVKPAVAKVDVVRKSVGETVYDYQSVIGIELGTNDNSVALQTNLYTKVGKEYVNIGYQRVTWSSSNKKIAEVSADGVVTGLKSGEVTITAKAIDGSNKSGKVKIYVGKLVKSLTPSDNIKDGISLNLRSRKSVELAGEITVAPITATNPELVYTSSDKKIVTVNAKGKVTGKKEGDAIITVTPKDGSGVALLIRVTVSG